MKKIGINFWVQPAMAFAMFVAIMVMISASSCTAPEQPTPVIRYYYTVNNVDIDGMRGDPAIAPRLRTDNDVLGPGSTTHTFEAGSLRFETFVCYDGVAGNKTNTANGARFGLRVTSLDNSIINPSFMFTENTVKNAGVNDVQTPLSQFSANTQITLSQFMQYAEPSTGIVWGSAHFESLPANITWELRIVGNTKRWDTSANFSSGSVITDGEVCSSFALPIEWVSMPQQVKIGELVYLVWSVNEIDVDYYEIKRSGTGREEFADWEYVDRVPSKTPAGQKGIGVVYMYEIKPE
jgi:hypothetical protein